MSAPLNYQAPADILSLSRALGTFVILPSRIREEARM